MHRTYNRAAKRSRVVLDINEILEITHKRAAETAREYVVWHKSCVAVRGKNDKVYQMNDLVPCLLETCSHLPATQNCF